MRPTDPVPLTIEEHRELGGELRATHMRLMELCNLIITVYGPNNQAAFTFEKVVDAMGRLCQDMESQAAHDQPGFRADGLYK